jgi:hypothetical protein
VRAVQHLEVLVRVSQKVKVLRTTTTGLLFSILFRRSRSCAQQEQRVFCLVFDCHSVRDTGTSTILCFQAGDSS